MYVIGVAGQAQMGKDTLADRLADRLLMRHGLTFERTAFASGVKKVFKDNFDVDDAFVENWKTKDDIPPGFDKPCRKSLQFIGDGFRSIRDSIWIDLRFRGREAQIISDVRYINEFKRVREEGGLNILIGRPDRLNDDPNGSEAQIRPYVEWCLSAFEPDRKFVDLRRFQNEQFPEGFAPPLLSYFDLFVRNDGSVEDLHRTVDDFVVPFVTAFNFRKD